MDWNVKNAISRDVERQQLNAILAEIRQSLSDVAKTKAITDTKDVRDIVGTMVSNNTEKGVGVTYNSAKKVLDFVAKDFTITLQGDVLGTGTVKGLNNIIITAAIKPGLVGIKEAPEDNQYYWRRNAEWKAVPPTLTILQDLKGEGFIAQHYDGFDPTYDLRTYQVAPGELTIINPNGAGGDPIFGLADTAVTPGTYGSLTTIPVPTVDQKGRITTIVNLPVVYEYTQAAASGTWTINHNLGFIPAVELYTPGGVAFDATVQHTSINQCIVYLAAAYTGTARLT